MQGDEAPARGREEKAVKHCGEEIDGVTDVGAIDNDEERHMNYGGVFHFGNYHHMLDPKKGVMTSLTGRQTSTRSSPRWSLRRAA